MLIKPPQINAIRGIKVLVPYLTRGAESGTVRKEREKMALASSAKAVALLQGQKSGFRPITALACSSSMLT